LLLSSSSEPISIPSSSSSIPSTSSSPITTKTSSTSSPKGFGSKPSITIQEAKSPYEKSRSEKKAEYRELVKMAKKTPSLKKMVSSTSGKEKNENFGGQRPQGIGGY
jgi:hypothetical protein